MMTTRRLLITSLWAILGARRRAVIPWADVGDGGRRGGEVPLDGDRENPRYFGEIT